MLTADDLLAPPGLAEGDKDGIAAAVARLMERLRAETFSARDGGKVLVDRATGESQPALFIVNYNAILHAQKTGINGWYLQLHRKLCKTKEMLLSQGAAALGYAIDRMVCDHPELFQATDDDSRDNQPNNKRQRLTHAFSQRPLSRHNLEIGILSTSFWLGLNQDPIPETISQRLLDLNMRKAYSDLVMHWKQQHTSISPTDQLKHIARGTNHKLFFDVLREHSLAISANAAGHILYALFDGMRHAAEYEYRTICPFGHEPTEATYTTARGGVRMLLARHAAASAPSNDIVEAVRTALASWTDVAASGSYIHSSDPRYLLHCIDLYCDTVEQAPLARARRRAIARLVLRHGLPEDVGGTISAAVGAPPIDCVLMAHARAAAASATERCARRRK